MGWGCDREGICREPTGEFEPPAEYRVGGASSLLAGDFDGDGRADILSRETNDAFVLGPRCTFTISMSGARSPRRGGFPRWWRRPPFAT